MAPVAGRDGVCEEGMVVDLDAQGSVLSDGTDEVEEECLRWVVCGGWSAVGTWKEAREVNRTGGIVSL